MNGVMKAPGANPVELERRAARELVWIEEALEDDPMGGLDHARRLVTELERFSPELPATLATLLVRARLALQCSRVAGEIFLAQCAERERHLHGSELEAVRLPVSRRRRPYG